MQGKKSPRTNRERTETSRAAMIAAARALFVERGYAETSTPEICEAAGLTRGALYHHFADKLALFRAVVESEAEAVASEIEQAAAPTSDPVASLVAGARAYMDAMARSGRAKLLLLEGPAVLGREAMAAIDSAHGNRTLGEGLEAAMSAGRLQSLPLAPLTGLLGAMFDHAALAVSEGASPDPYLTAMERILAGLQTDAENGSGKRG